jgi:hypothetical protein
MPENSPDELSEIAFMMIIRQRQIVCLFSPSWFASLRIESGEWLPSISLMTSKNRSGRWMLAIFDPVRPEYVFPQLLHR